MGAILGMVALAPLSTFALVVTSSTTQPATTVGTPLPATSGTSGGGSGPQTFINSYWVNGPGQTWLDADFLLYNGYAGSAYLQYGTTPSYGLTSETFITPPGAKNPIMSNGGQIRMTGLTCNTLYYARFKVVSSWGTSYSPNIFRTTAPCSGAVIGPPATNPCIVYTSGNPWMGPKNTPTDGNVDAPINVSATEQAKPGKLNIGPCPTPSTPTSQLTVNGITDTFGFSNWGATFLKGISALGTLWPTSTTTPAPMLYVAGPDASTPPAGYKFPRNAAVFNGTVSVMPPYKLYVNGYPVCTSDGTNCPPPPAPTTTTSGGNFWSASGTSNIYSTNPGTVIIGTTTPGTALENDKKLYVWGPTRLGAEMDYGGSTVLEVSPGTINFDAPGVGGGRMSINGNTGEVTIGGNLKVAGQNVCRQDGTNCPGAAGSATPSVPTDGQPHVLFTTGNGVATWKLAKRVSYGCTSITDGRVLFGDFGSPGSPSPYCYVSGGGNPNGQYGWLISP